MGIEIKQDILTLAINAFSLVITIKDSQLGR